MKWISFDDMEPPIGMNIIITRHEDINIVKWGSHNPDSSKGTVRVCDDEFCSLIMDWKLHYWAPVSFFKEHLPSDGDDDKVQNLDQMPYSSYNDVKLYIANNRK